MLNETAPRDADAGSCDLEPIHRRGSIQPQGVTDPSLNVVGAAGDSGPAILGRVEVAVQGSDLFTLGKSPDSPHQGVSAEPGAVLNPHASFKVRTEEVGHKARASPCRRLCPFTKIAWSVPSIGLPSYQ
ncbi:hypothetical protein [Neorhizobium alkalisoli]|uniref:Uncharacterized protein n=1 Tax=Neorhizobium alkalisoli TaxID=528178 RepID=A0A561PZ31_9HYPH|nr:hypothetical protein [Neorhizobium alkalisoli]TWF43373.1 hypothetical protein FHW37_12143 [Neorhizobium alkalisoli]